MDSINNYTSISSGGNLYPITVNIQNAHGGYTPINAISDSVTGDTMLYWKIDNELKYGSMEDLYCSYSASDNKIGFKVLSAKRDPSRNKNINESVNLNNANIDFERISNVAYHGIRPVYKITLRNGKTIKITKDHCIFGAKNYGGRMEALPLDELTKVVSVDDYGIKDDCCIPTKWNNDMLSFMGLWIGDVSHQKDGQTLAGVRISTGGESKIVEWLEEFSGNFMNQNNGNMVTCLKYSGTRYGDVYMNRRELARTIYQVMGNVYSETKRVPKEIFTATESQICAFLKGYFSGDGSIHICNDNPNNESYKYKSYYCVDCSSINRALLEDIGVLLSRIGIKYNITSPQQPSKTGFKNDKIQYKLIIHAHPSVDKFVKKVGFIKDFKYRPRISYQRDKKLRPVSLKQIRSIELIGPEPVYDIVGVENTERFVGNGFLLHNSGNEISIFKREVLDQLGFDINRGEDFNVAGINGPGRQFKKFRLMVKIGTLQPVLITIGFAVKKGDLVENLLGNKDVLKSGKFQVVYTGDSVTYTQKSLNARVSVADDLVGNQAIYNNNYENLDTRQKEYERRKKKVNPDDTFKGDGHHSSISSYGLFY